MRLSQFVILPPYRRQGHGSRLYNALFDYVLTLPKVVELTIEDPSEAFEDLRDRNDLKRLRQSLKNSPELRAPVDKQWMEQVRMEGKYAKVSERALRGLSMILICASAATILAPAGNAVAGASGRQGRQGIQAAGERSGRGRFQKLQLMTS